MKKITRNIFTENPNVDAFVIFNGSFNPFYLAINKGAPIEKRIKSIFKPDGYAWAEDVAYNCYIAVVPQSKEAYDAFIAYFLSNPLWTENLRCFRTQVLPYERSSFLEMKGGMYFHEGWTYSFETFGLSLYYDDGNMYIPLIDEEIPQYTPEVMRRVEAACSHLNKDQEEKTKTIFATLWNIYREGHGKGYGVGYVQDISRILG